MDKNYYHYLIINYNIQNNLTIMSEGADAERDILRNNREGGDVPLSWCVIACYP
jgi:hypothetical protein